MSTDRYGENAGALTRYKITAHIRSPHTVSASGSPASAPVFARWATPWQAGGERGFLFALQKAENRVPPSIKAASEAVAVSHTAAAERRPRESKKSNICVCVSHRRRKRGVGKSVRRRQGYGGTGRGVSPRRARSAPLRLPKSTRSPVRGEPPQTAARATFWNIVRDGAWPASAMP